MLDDVPPPPPRMPDLNMSDDGRNAAQKVQDHVAAMKAHFARADVIAALKASVADTEAFLVRNSQHFSHFENKKHVPQKGSILDPAHFGIVTAPLQEGGLFRHLMNLQTLNDRVVSNALTFMLLDLEGRGIVQDGLFETTDATLFEHRFEAAFKDLEHRRQIPGKDTQMSLTTFQKEYFTKKVYDHPGFEPDSKQVRVTRDTRLLPAISLGLLSAGYDGDGTGYNLSAGPVLSACITGPVETFLAKILLPDTSGE